MEDILEEAHFGTIDSGSQNNDFVLSLNEQALSRRKGNEKTSLIKRLNLGQPNQENNFPSERVTSLAGSKCPLHHEEDLQFYCFNKDKLLCPECLVTGKYAGYEISNLKKAVDRLKSRFNGLIVDAIDKFEEYALIEEEIETYEEEIEKSASGFEDLVTKQMNEIRQAINKKEQDLLQSISAIRQERLNELKSSTKWLHDFREEIENVKETGKEDLKNLGEVDLCKYYAKKTGTIKNLINGESNFKTNGFKEMLESYKIQDQLALSKVQEDCKVIKVHLENLVTIAKQTPPISSSTKETFRAIGASYFLPNPEVTTLASAKKESRESVLQRSVTPAKVVVPQKSTFLPKQTSMLSSEDTIELNSLPKTSTNRGFEKLISRQQQEISLRRPTPTKEVTTSDSRYASRRDIRRPEIGANLMIELKRENSSKRTNRSGLSCQDTNSLLESFKDILTKRTGGLDSKTPKNYMISVNSTPTKPFSSLLSSPNNLAAGTPSILSSLSPKVESREKLGNGRGVKNSYEIFTAELNKSSIKAFMRDSGESTQSLITDKMFAKRKAAERPVLTASSSEIGLKRRLNLLSSELFK